MTIISYFRQFKIYQMAIFDIVLTILFIFSLHLYMWMYPYGMNEEEKSKRNLLMYFVSLLIFLITSFGLGIIFHYIFSVKSTLSYYLGFNGKPTKFV